MLCLPCFKLRSSRPFSFKNLRYRTSAISMKHDVDFPEDVGIDRQADHCPAGDSSPTLQPYDKLAQRRCHQQTRKYLCSHTFRFRLCAPHSSKVGWMPRPRRGHDTIPPNCFHVDISQPNPPGIGALSTVHCIFSLSTLPRCCTSRSTSGL